MSLFAGNWGSLHFTSLTSHQSSFRNRELSGTSPHNFERSFERDEGNGVEVSTNMKLKHRRSLLEGRGFYDHFDSIFHDVALPAGNCGLHHRAHEETLPSDGKPEGKAYVIPIKIERFTSSTGHSPSQQTGPSRNLVGRPERSLLTLPDSKCVASGEENCFLNNIHVPATKCLKEHSAEQNDRRTPRSFKSVEGRYSPPPNFRLMNPTMEQQRPEQNSCWSIEEKENARSDNDMEIDDFIPSSRRRQSDEESVRISENFEVEEITHGSKNRLLTTSSLRRKPLRQLYDVTTTRTSGKSSAFLTAAAESRVSTQRSNATHQETSPTLLTNDVVLNDVICRSAAAAPLDEDADKEGRAMVHERRCCAAGVSVASPPPSYSVYKYLKATLASLERQVDYIKGDGNCFFRALSKEVYGSENYHAEWREAVVDVIESYPHIFRQYIDTNSMALHVQEMRRLGAWATTCEIYAAATLLQRNIYVLAPDHNRKEYRWLLFSPRQLTRQCTGGNMCALNTQTHAQGRSVGAFCRGHSHSTSGTSSAVHHCYLTLCHTNGNHYDRIMPAFVSCNCQLPPPSLDGATVLVDLTESDEDRE